MTVNKYTMGPGKLTLGAAPLDISAQVRSCVVTPSENVTSTDAVPVLSGEQLDGEDEVTINYVLSGTLIQDLSAAGVIDWTWSNATEQVPFLFVPNTAEARGVSGTCTIVPLAVGGDVKSRPESDFSFRCIGTPVFGVFDPVEGDVTEDV